MLRRVFNTFVSRYKGCTLSQSNMSMNTTACGMTRNLNYQDITNFLKIQDSYVIDVRTRKEVEETGTLPNALNVPLDELKDALNMSNDEFARKYDREKPLRDSKVIFSCRSGTRSADAMRLASSLGYLDPYNYAGGWLDWEAHVRGEQAMNKSD